MALNFFSKANQIFKNPVDWLVQGFSTNVENDYKILNDIFNAAKKKFTPPPPITEPNQSRPLTSGEMSRANIPMTMDPNQLDANRVREHNAQQALQTHATLFSKYYGRQPKASEVPENMSVIRAVSDKKAEGKPTTPEEDNYFKQAVDFIGKGYKENISNIISIPGKVIDIGKGLYNQMTNPSESIRAAENLTIENINKGLSKNLIQDPITKPIREVIVKGVTRFFGPFVEPGLKDLAETKVINEIMPKIQSGEIPASVLGEFETIQKSNPQIVADISQGVLSLLFPSVTKGIISGGGKTLAEKFIAGAVPAAEAGATFHVAQQVSAGETDVWKIIKEIPTAALSMGLFGGVLSGVIPASKEVVKKVEDIKAKIKEEAISKGWSPAEAENLANHGGYVGGVPDKNPLVDPLSQEATKYKTAEEFVKAQTKRPDYGYGHSPNSDGVPAFDLIAKVDGEQMIPKDMYTQWYGSRGTPTDLESIAVLKKIKGNPEADVTIYRASPKNEWNYGDWTTLSKKYAQEHATGNTGFKVFSKVVKAKDLKWAMDDVNEFGYFPESTKSQLIDIWNKAQEAPVSSQPTPVTDITIKGLADHARKYGGITVDFQGNIKDKGYAFSVLDKADEARLTIDENFDTIFKQKFNELKNKYGDNPSNHMGGWEDKGQFIVDVSHVSEDFKQSIYDGIIKQQDAIGDLGKYAKGEDGTIFITPEIINSLEPLGRGSFSSGKSPFKDWAEAVKYYTEKNFKNAPDVTNVISPELGTQTGGVTTPSGLPVKNIKYPAEDFIGNIRKSKLSDPVKAKLEEVATEAGDKLVRDRISLDKMVADAANPNLPKTKIIDDLVGLGEGKLASEMRRAQQDMANTILDVNASVDEMMAAAEKVSQAQAEIGRATTIQRVPLDDVQALTTTLKDKISKTEDPVIKNGLQKMLDMLNASTDKRNFVHKVFDPIVEAATASKLTSPFTYVRNAVGNLIGRIDRTVVKGLSGTYSFLEKVVGQKQQRFVGEAVQDAFGAIKGIGDATSKFFQAISDENVAMHSYKASDLANNKGRAIPGIVGKIIRIPFRFLSAADEAARSMGYSAEVSSLAYRQAKSEGLSGPSMWKRINELIDNPGLLREDFKKEADVSVKTSIYQQDLGPIGSAFQKLISSVPGGKLAVPFFKTIANLSKFAYQRSMLGITSPKNLSDLFSGDQIRRTEAEARLTIGAVTGATLTYLAWQGYITGTGPSDKNELAALKATGYQQFSIRLGDRFYSYLGFEPLAFQLSLAAAIHEAFTQQDKSFAGKANTLTRSIVEELTSQPFLTTVRDLMDAVNDKSENGNVQLAFVRRFLTGLTVPTGVAYLEKLKDPQLREAITLKELIQSKIPFWSDALPPKRGILGDILTVEGTLPERILIASTLSKEKENAVATELGRLKIFPSMPPKRIDGVELTAKEREYYLENVNGLISKTIADQMDLPGWSKLPDSSPDSQALTKEKIINFAFNNPLITKQKNIVSMNVLLRGLDLKLSGDQMAKLLGPYSILKSMALWKEATPEKKKEIINKIISGDFQLPQ